MMDTTEELADALDRYANRGGRRGAHDVITKARSTDSTRRRTTLLAIAASAFAALVLVLVFVIVAKTNSIPVDLNTEPSPTSAPLTKPNDPTASAPVSSSIERFNTAQLVDALTGRGFAISDQGSIPAGVLGTEASALCVNGTLVRVFRYADNDSAAQAARGIRSDGAQVTTGSVQAMVDWIGTPHFFAKGSIIVLVLNADQALLDGISAVMGPTISPRATAHGDQVEQCS